MVRLSAFPKCWIEDIVGGKMSVFEWIERSTELECDGLELLAGFLQSHDHEYLRRVRRSVETLGMTVPMLCYSPDFTLPDAGARQEQIAAQIEMIRVTAELGGQFCRTLSGQARPDVTTQQGVDWVVECITACLPAAQEYGIHLVIENHFKDSFWLHREFAQKKQVFLAIVNRIDSPWLGVQYDPSNAIVAGDDPLDVLDAVLPRVMTMHASDRYLLPGTSLDQLKQQDGTLGYPTNFVHGVTGRGQNDYDGIFTRLAGAGFDGWISIEDGMNGMAEMAESMRFLKRMCAKYFG